MYDAVQGPTPRIAVSAAHVHARSAPGSRTTSPSASADAIDPSTARRDAGIPIAARSASASDSGVGNRCVSPPSGPARGVPARATSRAASVRAAATLICWPSTARVAISAPSTAPGSRSPGAFATNGPRSGSVPSCSAMACGSASRSNNRRQRCTAVVRSRRSSSRRTARTWSGCGVSSATPAPWGRRKARR